MRSYLLLVLLMLPLLLYSGQTSIFDIQFTMSSGSDGTYPSPLRSQVVTVSGIVTANGYLGAGFFLSSREGGEWNGIYVSERGREVRIGDSIELQGEVAEQFGFTTIRNLRNFTVVNSANPLPEPVRVTTGELAVSEALEGVLVKLTNVSVTASSEQRGVWLIDDGSGVCRIADSFFTTTGDRISLKSGESFTSIVGVVDYRFGEFRINPRNSDDLKRSTVGVTRPSWGRIKSLYR